MRNPWEIKFTYPGETFHICEVPNNETGWEQIKNLRRGLRGTKYRINLRGRHENRKQLSQNLVNQDDPYRTGYNGFKMGQSEVHRMLRCSVPLRLSTRIDVRLGLKKS